MRIAVIIPYKNAAAWLPRCLESLDEHLEAYLINDHSTDGGHVIVIGTGLSTDNINPLWLEHDDHGVSLARNEGINEAIENGADYITFLDADDELTPDAYDVMAEAVQIFPNSDIIQLNHYRVIGGRRYCKFYNPRGDYDLGHLPGFWAVVWNKLYKVDLVNNIRFDVNLCHGEDELFNLECLEHARRISCFEKCTVIHHFDNPESLSKTTTASDLIREQRALINFLENHEHDAELCKAVRVRMTELWDNPIYKKTFGGE